MVGNTEFGSGSLRVGREVDVKNKLLNTVYS
jgi:hypothetical protein